MYMYMYSLTLYDDLFYIVSSCIMLVLCVCVCVSTYVCVCVYLSRYMYIYMHVCAYLYVCVQIHTETQTHFILVRSRVLIFNFLITTAFTWLVHRSCFVFLVFINDIHVFAFHLRNRIQKFVWLIVQYFQSYSQYFVIYIIDNNTHNLSKMQIVRATQDLPDNYFYGNL